VETVQSLTSLMVSRDVAASYGVATTNVQGPTLSPDAVNLLRPLLQSHSFDPAHPIRVEERQERGFWLTQVLVYPCPPMAKGRFQYHRAAHSS
jgi:hypothetical protein